MAPGRRIQGYTKRFKNNFIEWCKKNKVDQYIDYTSPKHYPGRALLGEIVEMKSVEEFDKLLNIAQKYHNETKKLKQDFINKF